MRAISAGNVKTTWKYSTGKQIIRPRRHPVARRWSLTLRTMSILARVIGDVVMAALGAGRHMPAERLGSAGLNGGHHFELAES